MRMAVLLLLVTAIEILIPSEAQAKGHRRYRIEQTGRNSWIVEESPAYLDDPDRFLFVTDPKILRTYGTDPEVVCRQPGGWGGGWVQGQSEAERVAEIQAAKLRHNAENEKCRAELAARIQERVDKAPTRPIAEIEAIPPKFRLPEEVQRMEDFAAAQAAKKTKGHKKPKADK